MTRMPEHETIPVRVGDREAEIDKEIAPLIRAMWEAEIRTTESCQETEPGRASIAFESARDALNFLDIVADPGGQTGAQLYQSLVAEAGGEAMPSLYRRVVRWDGELNLWDGMAVCCGWKPARGAWEFRFWLSDFALRVGMVGDGPAAIHHGKPIFMVGVAAIFPRTDLPLLLERMQEHNKARRQKDRAAVRNGKRQGK